MNNKLRSMLFVLVLATASLSSLTTLASPQFNINKTTQTPTILNHQRHSTLSITMTLRGVLLAGKWRTADELDHMPTTEKRNTLIVELSKHTNQPVEYFQGFDDNTLVGKGAVVVFLKDAGIRQDQELKCMSDGDERNTLIVENNNHTDIPIPQLQAMNDQQLVLMGVKWFD